MRAIAATAVGLLLVSLVALASGASPWQVGGRQDVSLGVVRALAAAAGALIVGSLLLDWVGRLLVAALLSFAGATVALVVAAVPARHGVATGLLGAAAAAALFLLVAAFARRGGEAGISRRTGAGPDFA